MVLVDVFVEMPQFCSSRVLESTRNVSVWHNQNYHTVSVGIACQARVFAISGINRIIINLLYMSGRMANTSLRFMTKSKALMSNDVRWDFQSLENAPRIRGQIISPHCQKQNQYRTQTSFERLFKLRTAVFYNQILSLVEKCSDKYPHRLLGIANQTDQSYLFGCL